MKQKFTVFYMKTSKTIAFYFKVVLLWKDNIVALVIFR